MEHTFNSSIRGYHVYKSIWSYEIGDELRCEREEDNPNDKFAVKLEMDEEILAKPLKLVNQRVK